MPRRRDSGTIDGVFDYGVTVEGPVDSTSDIPQEAVEAAVDAIEGVIEDHDPKGSTDEDAEDDADNGGSDE